MDMSSFAKYYSRAVPKTWCKENKSGFPQLSEFMYDGPGWYLGEEFSILVIDENELNVRVFVWDSGNMNQILEETNDV